MPGPDQAGKGISQKLPKGKNPKMASGEEAGKGSKLRPLSESK